MEHNEPAAQAREMPPLLGSTSLSALTAFFLVWPFLGFALSRILRRNDVADLLWGTGIAALAWLVALPHWGELTRAQLFLLTLVSMWGLRLTAHLAVRNLPRPEDQRYVDMRNRWGRTEPLNAYLRVFLLQSALAIFVALAAWWKLRAPLGLGDPLTWIDQGAVALAVIGLGVETSADFTLLSHMNRAHPKPPVLRSGLWAWSRHPNYFGETVFWWGVSLVGIRSGLDLLGLLGALLITWLLLRVSGVPLLDARTRTRGPEHQAYLAEVSGFIPMPPSLWRKIRSQTK